MYSQTFRLPGGIRQAHASMRTRSYRTLLLRASYVVLHGPVFSRTPDGCVHIDCCYGKVATALALPRRRQTVQQLYASTDIGLSNICRRRV